MLDLHSATRTVAGVDLALDESNPRAFYILPPPPRAAQEQGVPAVELLRFIEAGRLTGGHLRLVVELSHPAATLDEAARLLAAELDEETVELRPLPVIEADAVLQFVGRAATADGALGDLTEQGFGQTAAQAHAPHKASFSVQLSPDGVRLVEAALRSGGAPVGVIYRLRVEGLWPAQRVLAKVDWERVYDHLSVHSRRGDFFTVQDLKRLTEQLIDEKVVSIHAVAGLAPGQGGGEADIEQALTWVQTQLVDRFCEPILPLAREPAGVTLGDAGELFGVGSAFKIKKRTQIERGLAEVDLQRSAVLTRTLTAHAQLLDLLKGAPADEHIGDADREHPFFERMRLHVDTARPLPESHLDEVVLQFVYGSEEAAAQLTAAQAEANFDAWADAAEDHRWSLAPELAFSATSPVNAGERVRLAPLTGDSRELTLDLERLLGLVRIDVQGSPDDRVALTRARLKHSRQGQFRAEQNLRMIPAEPAQAVWFRDFRDEDQLEAEVEYLLRDGRRVAPAPVVVDTRVVRLPPPFPGVMTVQILSDDDWTGLERVIVAIQKSEELPAGTFEFTEPGKLVPVNLDLPDPTDRRYRYRATRTWATGQVEEDDWAATDASVLVVGRVAANKLVVDLQPIGAAELPEAGIRLIEVELLYVDVENQVRETGVELIRARADRPRWEIAVADPARRQYEYRVTIHRTSGEKQVGSWTKSSERILLIPLAAAAPV